MFVESLAVGFAVVKILLRIADKENAADILDDVHGGLASLRAAGRQTALAESIAKELDQHLGGTSGEAEADLRAAAREPTAELGRLVVVASPSGEPAAGSAFSLDAITSLGRDVNNSIVIEDEFVSANHAALTYRGRAWYVEDIGSTNGTFVNGSQVDGLSPIAFGDEVQIGQVRLRLERARA